jgi:murein DD-endopeptidase MepM/ murein hydrolase activator NlpD
MKHPSVLIVSQNGKPVRSVRIRFLAILFLVLLLVCGLASYIIPANVFRIKSLEQYQKKELGAQNDLLRQRILAALSVLSHVKNQTSLLDMKKEKVAALSSTGAAAGMSCREAAGYAGKEPAALFEYICRLDSIVSAFAVRTAGRTNPFENIPVCKPVSWDTRISRRFGENRDPFTGKTKLHEGIDIAAPSGTPVTATATGYVVSIENDEVWGKRVVVNHGNGISTVYAHLGSVATGRGRPVKRGGVIGYIGYSGLTTGPHVHYEIRRNGVALDPETFFFPSSARQ